MSQVSDDKLLARLAGRGNTGEDTDPWSTLAAVEPNHDAPAPPDDAKLDALLNRLQTMTKPAAKPAAADSNDFMPTEPTSFQQAGLTDTQVEALVLKFLLVRGDVSGRAIGEQIRLPFVLLDELLRRMKNERLLTHRGSAPMNDFVYELTDLGRERGRRYATHCTYFGSAPVSLKDYVASVTAQSLTQQHPTPEQLRRAFDDLLLSPRLLDRLGPAVNSGRGLFLYGNPGNGKTSIAQRVTRAFGQTIWIPRAIGVDGEIMRLYDPAAHEEIPLEACDGVYDKRKIDKRWVRIRRPTIIAGGELTMNSLEVTVSTSTGISEAPLQMKSNCGTLVIDDFGRQRMSIRELLNRWILPLEMRQDFLSLSNGKKIQVPFDQLIIFSTNLEPRELVDEAFLRRIPYKIEIIDPTEQEFRALFRMMAPKLGFEYREEPIDYLVDRYYRQADRKFRCCHPRDLLMQICSFCAYKNAPLEITNEYLDLAVENYFAVM